MAKFIKIGQSFINLETIQAFKIDWHYARRYLEIRTSDKEDAYSIDLDECDSDDVNGIISSFESFISNEETFLDLNQFWEKCLSEMKNHLHESVDLNLEAFIKNADFKVNPSINGDDAYLVHKFISTVINAKNCVSSSIKYDNEKLCVIMRLIPDMSYLKDNNVLDMVHVKIPTTAYDCMKYLCKDNGYLYCSTIEFDHAANTLTWVFPYKEGENNG